MNVLGSLRLGVLLTALVVTGAMALAQEQGQRKGQACTAQWVSRRISR